MIGFCLVTGKSTCHNFEGISVEKEVLEFARKYRDALSQNSQRRRNLRGVLVAFQEMKKFGHDWTSIKKKLIDEMKDKGISLD